MASDLNVDEETGKAIKDKLFSGYVCKKCKKVNPKGSLHCRSCGYSKADSDKGKWWRHKKGYKGKR